MLSKPEDAVSRSHDVEPTDDGASTDVVVVSFIVCVPLKRHLTKRNIQVELRLLELHKQHKKITKYPIDFTCHFQVLGAALWPPMTLPFFTKESSA